ncbi:hypothetical protein C8J55DRAFT_519970 [Lentinula edodes]|uniref:Uncharacterized protein n=1 Tax=Lentinula lateritia TaxID=40482 RepID=A0A9W9A435_9AGAR|nr:hypothetical protein C8J55DRAFT_519970 [Lentinula edodes]
MAGTLGWERIPSAARAVVGKFQWDLPLEGNGLVVCWGYSTVYRDRVPKQRLDSRVCALVAHIR